MKFKLAAFADEASSALDGQIRAMKDNGISLLEIRGVDGENIADLSKEKARLIRQKLDDNGLGVWSLGSPYGKIDLKDDFDAHLEKFKRSIEICDILGTRHIRLFSFYGAQDCFDDVAERIGKFLDAAAGTDIVLCHENEKGIFGDLAENCLELHMAFPKLKAIFDPANYVQCGQDTKAAWEMLSPYVEYMHIKDALPDGSVVPAGKGAGNLAYLLSNYQGEVLTIEPHLSVFEGLDALEAGQKTQIPEYAYPDSFTAFRAATDALKDLIS